jgi:HD-like signal output (HDOD) protein
MSGCGNRLRLADREAADRHELPELATDALAAGRSARHVAWLLGFSRIERETLFISSIFSSTGAAPLKGEDAGYLACRANQRARGLSEDQMLRREQMAYDRDHAVAAAKLLDEWNMPTPIIEAVAATMPRGAASIWRCGPV